MTDQPQGATWADLVREFFPDADDRTVEAILWEKTGYPSFFAGDPETVCRAQLTLYKESLKTRKGTL